MSADPFKSITTLVEAKRTAKLADAAAREMAKHFDARMKKINALLDELEAAFKRIDYISGNMDDTAASRCGDVGRQARAALKLLKAANTVSTKGEG